MQHTAIRTVENKPDFSYSRAEKLKSKKLFEKMFAEGKSVANFPLRVIYVKADFKDNVPIKAGVTVSKRNFKSAVKRNRIKRLLREAYRLNKSMVSNNSTDKYALLILYLGKEMPESKAVHQKMEVLLDKFNKKIAQESKKSTSEEIK
ncbi:ribonuclease P protein component [Cellulophaga baltica]|uniref:ribonuclease P protein component n=1 Tax=Cellulophaga baltica TaxID=76594 RepID=UPI00214890A3|nr:ribonuclease P protein component [Cellulophaga baltica]MCR1025802.1 ribonuclease P protein component [Cellulophaga baltica]